MVSLHKEELAEQDSAEEQHCENHRERFLFEGLPPRLSLSERVRHAFNHSVPIRIPVD
jgi:hypothetical protein